MTHSYDYKNIWEAFNLAASPAVAKEAFDPIKNSLNEGHTVRINQSGKDPISFSNIDDFEEWVQITFYSDNELTYEVASTIRAGTKFILIKFSELRFNDINEDLRDKLVQTHDPINRRVVFYQKGPSGLNEFLYHSSTTPISIFDTNEDLENDLQWQQEKVTIP